MTELPGDNYLMGKVKSGDTAAFEELFRKYQHGVLNFFHKLCFSRTTAEDLTQEAFLRLWRARQGYRPDAGKFSTYLFQIAKNCWINYTHRRKRRAGAGKAAAAGYTEAISDTDPAGQAEGAELQRKLQEAISSLPDDLRIPFVLSRYEDLRYEEIGRVLSISPRTVERRVGDAAKLLAKRLIGK
jgi:RNA polymerase sigma-70 factor (ECF subfamily)